MKHTYKVTGMSCSGCSDIVREAVEAVPGVLQAQVLLDKQEAVITMDQHVSIDELKKALRQIGGHYDIHLPNSPLDHHHKKPDVGHHKNDTGTYYCPMLCEGEKRYPKPGDCPKCGMHLVKEEKVLSTQPTEYTCPMHPEIRRKEPGSCSICGMDLTPIMSIDDPQEEDTAHKVILKKFWVALAFTLPVFFIAMSEMIGISLEQLASNSTWGWIQFVLSTPVIFYSCREFFIRGYYSVINKSPNMWTLISLGAGAAYGFSIIALIFPDIFPDQFKTASGTVHLYFEAATVILTLILLGQVLEVMARGQTNSAIRELLNLVPQKTTVIREWQGTNSIS